MSNQRSSELQTVLDQIDIIEHITQFEPLKPESNRFVGTHQHANSKGKRCLHIYPEKQSWYCYHCGKGGTVFDYEMSRQGIDFAASYDFLRTTYHIAGPNWTPEQRKQFQYKHDERTRVQDIIIE